MTYIELRQALAVFDLPDRVTLAMLRKRHRQLVRKYHPDSTGDADNHKIREVNGAYQVLQEYVADYCFDFSRKTFLDQYPEERLREQFSDSELWRRQT
ncbi:MAG: J domain-containing protein [Desulfopila sp.]